MRCVAGEQHVAVAPPVGLQRVEPIAGGAHEFGVRRGDPPSGEEAPDVGHQLVVGEAELPAAMAIVRRHERGQTAAVAHLLDDAGQRRHRRVVEHHVDDEPALVVAEVGEADAQLLAHRARRTVTGDDEPRRRAELGEFGGVDAEAHLDVRVLLEPSPQHRVDLGLDEDEVLVPAEDRCSLEPLEAEQRDARCVDVLHAGRDGQQAAQLVLEAEVLEHAGDLGIEMAGAGLRVRRGRPFEHDGAQAPHAAQVGEGRAGGTEADDRDVVRDGAVAHLTPATGRSTRWCPR